MKTVSERRGPPLERAVRRAGGAGTAQTAGRAARARRTIRPWAVALLALLALLAVSSSPPPASAQVVLTGHYVPLFASGLKSGMMPTRPGFIYQNSTYFYHTTTFRDDEGNRVDVVDELNIAANRNTLVYVTPWKLRGVHYAAAFALPFANLAPNPVIIDGIRGETGIGLTDIALVPVILGWHGTQWHAQGGYTFFAPTGRFEQGGSKNTGKGFWTHMVNLGVTWQAEGERPWHVSLMTRYEVHSKQEGSDLKPGDTLTLEFGLGKKIAERVELGVVGHHWRQVTGTRGPAAVGDLRFESSGFGGEVQFPIWRSLSGKARVGGDFGARLVSEGPWAVFEITLPL